MGPCLKVTITVFPPRLFAICPPKSCLIWLYVKVFNLKLFPEFSNVKIKLRQLVRGSENYRNCNTNVEEGKRQLPQHLNAR